MNKKITLEEVILELQPFSEELVTWCKTHLDFFKALKNIYPEKFVSPAMIVTSYPTNGDEVIGVYTYHHEIKTPIFKQDFIINVGRADKEFVLYTRNPTGSSKNVKDINEFFAKYSKYGYTKEAHHLTLEQLPEQLQDRAKKAIAFAEKLKTGLPQQVPQALIDKIYKEVMEIKRKDRIIKEKLKNDEH
jgi:hypothetical protein